MVPKICLYFNCSRYYRRKSAINQSVYFIFGDDHVYRLRHCEKSKSDIENLSDMQTTKSFRQAPSEGPMSLSHSC